MRLPPVICLARKNHAAPSGWLFLFFFWSAFFLVSFAPAEGRAALLPGADLAIDQKKQSAITLLQLGRPADAYDAFMQLLRENPDDDDINMGIALSAYASKKYAQSLMAYERLIAKFPRDANLRVQVARVYVALDEPESARLELQKAKLFDSSITDDGIAEVLNALTSQKSRWQHQGRISAGVVFDDNSNQGPRSNYMTLGAFQNLFVNGVRKKSSWGSYLMGSMEVGYRLGEESPMWIMADALGYQRWNTSSGVTANNQFTFGRTSLGFRYVGEKTLFDLRMKMDQGNQQHDKAKDQNIFSFGPEMTFVVAVRPYLQLLTRAAVEKREYSVSRVRDGHYWSMGQFGRFFFGKNNHELMAGVTFTANDPSANAYSYEGVEPSLRFVFKLPYEVSISPFVAYREEKYTSPATGLETMDRMDNQWRAGATVAWDITKNLTLDANYQYVDNRSTSQLYQYDQNVFSMGLTLKF